MNILSINFSHDGAGVVLRDGALAGYVCTERFSRRKKQPGLRDVDLDELLAQANLRLEEVDLVVLANVGMKTNEMRLVHGTDFDEELFAYELDAPRARVTIRGVELPCVVNPDHFLCHSAVAFHFSPFERAVCFSYDAIASGVSIGRGSELHELPFARTKVGDLYSRLSKYDLALGGVFGAGKTMGLAPYGRHAGRRAHELLSEAARGGTDSGTMPDRIRLIRQLSKEHAVWYSDGPKTWNAAIAYHAQEFLELSVESLLDQLLGVLSQQAPDLGPRPNLCISGGTALNSVVNQRIVDSRRFASVYLHPACGDDGTAIGAALLAHSARGGGRRAWSNAEAMYSRREYPVSERTFAGVRDRVRAEARHDWIDEAARRIADGQIIGWFRGPSEIGPRALGNRSILADPRRADMKDVLNARVKFRESFRPFAPSVLNEHALEWFGTRDSPFMLRVAPVLLEGVPAITHVDRSARLQTVAREDNPDFHDLIDAFRRRTGVPMVLNTSFNIRSEPIVETPEDALDSLLRSDLDAVVFPGLIVEKVRSSAGQ